MPGAARSRNSGAAETVRADRFLAKPKLKNGGRAPFLAQAQAKAIAR